jgi:tetratricopeptide (TPR) repeat protein
MAKGHQNRLARIKLMSLYQKAVFFTGIIFAFGGQLHGKDRPSPTPQHTQIMYLDDLEVRTWTSEDSDIFTIENTLIRELQNDPNSAYIHYLLSHIMLRAFSQSPSELFLLKQASDLAQQAIDLAPQSDFGYVALADVLDQMGNPEKAQSLLEASNFNNKSWRAIFNHARLAEGRIEAQQMLQLYDKALLVPGAKKPIIMPYVVASLQSEYKGERLVSMLEKWNQRYPSPLLDLTLAISYTESSRFDLAHKAYQNILVVDPQNVEAKINDAVILYKNFDRPNEAITLFEPVVSNDLRKLTVSTQSLIWAHLGVAYLKTNNKARAEHSFIESISVSDDFQTLRFIATSYKELGMNQELTEMLLNLNAKIPGNGLVYALLGETLSEKLSRHEEALVVFSDAITLEPERSDYYNGMGLTYYRMAKYKEALKLFTHATLINPNDATAKYNEACVFSITGQKVQAIDALKEALALDPSLSKNAQTDGDFNNIHQDERFVELLGNETASDLLGH